MHPFPPPPEDSSPRPWPAKGNPADPTKMPPPPGEAPQCDPRHDPDRREDAPQHPAPIPGTPGRTNKGPGGSRAEKKVNPKRRAGEKIGGDHFDTRPISKREWAIIISDQELVAILNDKLGMKASQLPGLVSNVQEAIRKGLRCSFGNKMYHFASEAFQEVILTLCKSARAIDDPIRKLPDYLSKISRNAANKVIRQSRCVSMIRDKDGNRQYVARLQELTPSVMDNLEDHSEVNDCLRKYHAAVAEEAIAAIPEKHRSLFLAYIQGRRRQKRETFLKDHKEALDALGINTQSKLSHWVRRIRRDILDLREAIEKRAQKAEV